MSESPAKRRWWLVEVWIENREEFKAYFTHLCKFVMLIGVLLGIGVLIEIAKLPQERKQILEALDFYTTVAVLGVLSLTAVIKALRSAVKDWRK